VSATLTDTVWAFIARASELHGAAQAQYFAQDMQANCLEIGMQSPIEHLFWIAANCIASANFATLNPPPDVGFGIDIKPQAQFGKYRVDFLIRSHGYAPDGIYLPVVVELDGHDFHDKDKRQRSYEKRRDRDLVRAGCRVLHFTGSDVVKDPFACAWEALEMVGLFVGRDGEGLVYSPTDPLGMGE
jgi:very-short-patch-repair endonuclease